MGTRIRVEKGGCLLKIRLPHLKLHYYTPARLSIKESYIGKPLSTDKLTANQERISYATICVQLEIGAKKPKSIPYYNDLGNWITKRLYMNPPRCRQCKVFGHSHQQCAASKTVQKWKPKAASISKNDHVHVDLAVKMAIEKDATVEKNEDTVTDGRTVNKGKEVAKEKEEERFDMESNTKINLEEKAIEIDKRNLEMISSSPIQMRNSYITLDSEKVQTEINSLNKECVVEPKERIGRGAKKKVSTKPFYGSK